MKNHARLMSVAALALAAGCATGGSIPMNPGWNVVSTKHFKIYADNSYRLEETITSLELQYTAMASSFFAPVSEEPLEVLMVDESQFHDLFGLKRGAAAVPSVPGGADIGQKGLIILQPIGSGEDRASGGSEGGINFAASKMGGVAEASSNQTTIGEAVSHIFIHRMFPKAPLWFHEGFASWSANSAVMNDNNAVVACLGRPSSPGGTFIALPKFFSMTWQDYDSEEGRGWYKGTAKTLIDYVFYGEDTKRRTSLSPLVNAVDSGASNADIVKKAFPDLSMDKLNTAVQEHAKVMGNLASMSGEPRGHCPVRFAVKPGKQPDTEEPVVAPFDAGKVKAALAGLDRLPKNRDGYPPWFMDSVVESAASKK